MLQKWVLNNGTWFQGEISKYGKLEGRSILISPREKIQFGLYKDGMKHGKMISFSRGLK